MQLMDMVLILSIYGLEIDYGYCKDEKYKYVSDDLYKNGILDDNDNEITNNVKRKIFNRYDK